MSMTADTAAEATAAAPAFARRQVVEVVKHTGPETALFRSKQQRRLSSLFAA